MNVKDVKGLQHQVAARALNLVGEIGGSHAMHPACNFSGIENAALYIFVPEIRARIGGGGAIKAEISRLGADQNLIARNVSGSSQRLEGRSDVSLRELVAVGNRRIQKVDAGAERSSNGLLVAGIGGCIRLSKIRAQPNG